jgi:hypothetical protein
MWYGLSRDGELYGSGNGEIPSRSRHSRPYEKNFEALADLGEKWKIQSKEKINMTKI